MAHYTAARKVGETRAPFGTGDAVFNRSILVADILDEPKTR